MCKRLQFGLLILVTSVFLNAQWPKGALTPAPITDGSARVLELTGQVSVMRSGDWWALMPNGTDEDRLGVADLEHRHIARSAEGNDEFTHKGA